MAHPDNAARVDGGTLAARARRCLADSAAHTVTRRGPWRIYHKREVDPDAVLAAVRGGSASLPLPSGAPIAVHIKAVTRISLWQNFKDLFQMPRGRRAYVALCGFELAGLPAPEGIALVEERRRGILRASYLVTRRIDHAMNLSQYLHRHWVAPRLLEAKGDTRALRTFLAAFAGTLNRVHAAGVHHRDMKGENLLLTEDSGTVKVYFVDFDALRFRSRVDSHRVVKNLAQLAASLPYCFPMRPRLRFFAHYMSVSPFQARRKEILAQTVRMTRARMARWLRLFLARRRAPRECAP